MGETDILTNLLSQNQNNSLNIEKFRFRSFGALYLKVTKNLTSEEAIRQIDSLLERLGYGE